MRRKVTHILLPAALGMLLLCSSCSAQVNIRFVDKNGAERTVLLPAAETGTAAQPQTQAPEQSTAAPEQSTAAPQTQESTTPADPASAAPRAPAEQLSTPRTPQEIVALYQSAVQRVRGGEAGYDKKTWESASVEKLTGISAVDGFVSREVEKRATPEAEAQAVSYEKGTADAVTYFPNCTLTDLGNVASASCTQEGDRLKLTIVMQDEDTPESVDRSMLGTVTDIILFKNEIERELHDTLPMVKNYEYGITYHGFEITCELTRDGRFISLRHHAEGRVHVSAVQILLFELKDCSAALVMDAAFTDFIY